ncbi:hypothetical protein ACW7G0_09280 [Lysobacter sp. A286]
MIQLEVQVVSDHREGLLVELGRVVHSNGFTVQRQRLTRGSAGEACLTLLIRGPAERQMVLEEALATHARVRSFEAALYDGSPASVASSMLGSAASPLAASAVSAPPASAPAPTSMEATETDSQKVEAALPQIAKDYPRIFPWLLSLERSLAPDARHASLHLAGRRTGAWVYKRDFSLGAKLQLHDAVKRIGLPALRALAPVELQGEQLRLSDHPLAKPGVESGGCRFFCGYLEGLLSESVQGERVYVRETFCRSTGADACTFEISH